MEVTLWEILYADRPVVVYEVLILVLVEVTLWVIFFYPKSNPINVLILVLVEVTLWDDAAAEQFSTTLISLNPCFSGSYSLSTTSLIRSFLWANVLILVLVEVTLWVNKIYYENYNTES